MENLASVPQQYNEGLVGTEPAPNLLLEPDSVDTVTTVTFDTDVATQGTVGFEWDESYSYEDNEEEQVTTKPGQGGPDVGAPNKAQPAPNRLTIRMHRAGRRRRKLGAVALGAFFLASIAMGVLTLRALKPKEKALPTHRPRPDLPKHPDFPPLDPGSRLVEEHLNDVNHSLTQLGNAWQESSELVRVAFAQHYIPAKTAEKDPCVLFEKHAATLREAAKNLPPEKKTIYILNCQLMTVAVRAAITRVVALQEIEGLCRGSGTGSALLDLAGPPLPKTEELKGQREDLVSFSQFLSTLKGFPLDVALPVQGEEPENLVPSVLADKLAYTALLRSLDKQHNMRVAMLFSDFVNIAGPKTSLVTFHNQALFPVSQLASALNSLEGKEDAGVISSEDVQKWMQHWDVDGIKAQVDQLETRQSLMQHFRRDIKALLVQEWQDHILEVLPGDDLFSLVIAVL